jgi:hypothetical protein
MASKVLKVKLWDGEDGKKWKCNVQDIEGEILCGASMSLLCCHVLLISRHARPSWCHPLMIRLLPFCITLTPHSLLSLTIHPPRVYEEREQARFPQSGSADQRQRAIRQLHWPGPLPLPRGPCQGRRLRCDDGRGTGQ